MGGYHGMAFARHSTHSDGSDHSGWNGWLYPVLFIVLPIVAGLMVLALIACNVYEYYQKKKRLEQYHHYNKQSVPAIDTEPDKCPENGPQLDESKGLNGLDGYNEAQFTYSTIFGNYIASEGNREPIRPMSGWVAPHM